MAALHSAITNAGGGEVRHSAAGGAFAGIGSCGAGRLRAPSRVPIRRFRRFGPCAPMRRPLPQSGRLPGGLFARGAMRPGGVEAAGVRPSFERAEMPVGAPRKQEVAGIRRAENRCVVASGPMPPARRRRALPLCGTLADGPHRPLLWRPAAPGPPPPPPARCLLGAPPPGLAALRDLSGWPARAPAQSACRTRPAASASGPMPPGRAASGPCRFAGP